MTTLSMRFYAGQRIRGVILLPSASHLALVSAGVSTISSNPAPERLMDLQRICFALPIMIHEPHGADVMPLSSILHSSFKMCTPSHTSS